MTVTECENSTLPSTSTQTGTLTQWYSVKGTYRADTKGCSQAWLAVQASWVKLGTWDLTTATIALQGPEG